MRYILDIADTTGAPANYAKEFMEEICETMADHIVTIVCIDDFVSLNVKPATV